MRCALIVLIFSLPAGRSTAQSGKSDFAGTYYAVFYLTSGDMRSGTWINCTESSVQFAESGLVVELLPQDIYKISVRRSNPGRSVGIGAGIGFTVGFTLGFIAFNTEGDTDLAQIGHAAGAGLIGAFSGALIGQLVARSGKSYDVLGQIEQYHRIMPHLLRYNQ